MLHIFGLPVFGLKTQFMSDGVRYDFDGIINEGLIRHTAPSFALHAIALRLFQNDNSPTNRAQ